jgi:ABC-type polar amino acid transport system ATPase subunit
MSEQAEQPLEFSGLDVQTTERITLSVADRVWRVEAGYLDIFRIPVENGVIAGMRQHVTRLQSGQVAFALPASDDDPFIVMAVGSSGAILRDMTRDQLQASGAAAASIERWVAGPLAALTPSAPPPGTRTIAAFEEVSLDTHHTVSAQEVVWIELQDGHLVYPSSDNFAPYPVTGLMPVSEHSWLACHEPATVRAMDSAELFDQYAWRPLDQFHDFALARLAQLHAQSLQAEQTRMAARTALNQRALSGALSQVLAVTGMAEEALPPLGTASQADRLLAALRVVGRVSHIDLVKTPPASNGDAAAVDHLRRLADASGVRMRQITLQGEWWQQESSACLGFRRDSGVPCALVPSSRGHYRLYDAETGQDENVDATRALAVLRMEGKANAALQAAIWDRLLQLPTTFFRRYTAGDLAMRAMGVDAIRQVLSGVTVTAAISGAFSLVNFGMMFYYDGRLTAVAVGLLIVFLGLTTIMNLRQLRVQRQAYETEGRVAGLLLQLLNGIAKLRVANVEARAFNIWAKLFATQRSLLFRGRSIINRVTVINSIFPIFSSMALFSYVAWKLEALSIGSIFYDGKDLGGLDLRAVRKQLGVVLQKGALMPGSIFDNIVGSEPLSQDDAWEAARLAGLEDDLQTMPMGMQTMVSEGAATLSGGQRQRLLIARALVRRPRLILFDEATSALDNRTQEIISQSLEQFNATRIVIAHRLSTIQNADRICVIEAGRLVQQGTFDDLMAVDGPFATLARRQLV